MVKLSNLHTGRLYPQEVLLVPIFLGWVDPRTIMQLEELSQSQMSMIPSGIEPVTSRLVAQCLNQLHRRVPSIRWKNEANFTRFNFEYKLESNTRYSFT